MFNYDKYNKQQNLLEYEHVSIDQAKQKDNQLNERNPDEIIELIATDVTERHFKKLERCAHAAE
jgi:hypothetical protein